MRDDGMVTTSCGKLSPQRHPRALAATFAQGYGLICGPPYCLPLSFWYRVDLSA